MMCSCISVIPSASGFIGPSTLIKICSFSFANTDGKMTMAPANVDASCRNFLLFIIVSCLGADIEDKNVYGYEMEFHPKDTSLTDRQPKHPAKRQWCFVRCRLY